MPKLLQLVSPFETMFLVTRRELPGAIVVVPLKVAKPSPEIDAEPNEVVPCTMKFPFPATFLFPLLAEKLPCTVNVREAEILRFVKPVRLRSFVSAFSFDAPPVILTVPPEMVVLTVLLGIPLFQFIPVCQSPVPPFHAV